MGPEQALNAWQASGQPAIDPRLLLGFALPLLQQLTALGSTASTRLPLLALNGPVGAGKTSLGRLLEALAPTLGLRLVVASIDDLYLPWAQRQRRLAGNPFAVSRVPPGSHDLELLLDALGHWRQSGVLRLPRFDKTLAQGHGDRSGWRQEPCDALVLEGWLMGCRALGPVGLATALSALDLGRPNAAGAPALTTSELDWLGYWDSQLEAYGPLWQACDGLWVLRPLSWELPRRWRFQAEARQRRNGGGWLPAADLERLVRSSLCSLPPALYQDPLAVDPQLVPQPEPAASLLAAQALARPPAVGPHTGSGLAGVSDPPSPVTDDSDADDRSMAADAWTSRLTGPRLKLQLQAETSNAETRHAETRQAAPKTTAKPAAPALVTDINPDQPAQAMGPGAAAADAASAPGLTVQGLAVLDGRRRCVDLWRRQSETQASPSDSSSLMG